MPELDNKTTENENQNLEERVGASDTESTDEKQDGGKEMVTKAEAQKMADAMVAKKLKGMPSKEELAKYKEWQESQKTAEEKRAEEAERFRVIEAENTSLKQEKLVLSKGVKLDDADYVLFKVGKMEGDFEENLESFLLDNPKFTNSESASSATDGVATKRNSGSKTSSIDEKLKARHPELDL